MASNDPRTWDEVVKDQARADMLKGPTIDPSEGGWGPTRTLSPGGTEVRDWIKSDKEQAEYDSLKGQEDRRNTLRQVRIDANLAREEEFNRKWGPEATNFDVGAMGRGSGDPYTGPTHFTNVPGTIGQWQSEGVASKDIGFIAENTKDYETAKNAGVGKIDKSDTYQETIPPQPSPDQLDSMKIADGFWNHIKATHGWKVDPTEVNAVEAGIIAKQKFVDAHSSEFLDPTGANYAKFDKAANEVQKDAENRAKFAHDSAWKIRSEVFKFAASDEAKKAIEARTQQAQEERRLANTKAANDERTKVMSDWRSYDLDPETLKKIEGTPTNQRVIPPAGAKLKPEVLAGLNQVLSRSGQPEMTPEEAVVQKSSPGWFGTNIGATPEKKGTVYKPKAGGATGGAQGGSAQYVVGKQYPGTGKYAGKIGTYMGNGQWQIR